MGKRIICGCVVLGIVACLIGCQKSDNYELMKESKQQVLPIYEKKDAEVQGEKCALETLQDVYKSDYILEEWKIEKIGEPGGIFCNDEAVLISDKKTDCIFEVDYAGNILKEVGGTGSGEGEFISPSAITMCNEKIYVLDQGNNRIQVLDKELDYIEEIKLKNTQSTDPNYIPEVLSVNQESIYVTGVSLENPVVDKYTDGKLKEIGSNFIGSIYSCNNQIYLINSMVRYYDEANDSFGALTSCPEWLMTSLQAINKVALLFMAVFLTGMIAIYQLRFEHREESYGISLAYGAQYKELYWEIFCEILLLNSIGTIIGIVIGYLVTYYVDFGIMISVVNVQGSWYTFLSAYGLCVVLSSFVSVITFRKLKKKKIIELLNVY